MSNKILLQKYNAQIKNKENKIKKLEKNLCSYRFKKCKTYNDFELEKLKLELELKEVKKEIFKAGAKYNSSLVAALKNKEGRIKTKINNVNNILVSLEKINSLKSEISDLENEIKILNGEIKPMFNEREQMNIVLKALRNNFSHEDAAKLANIEIKRMVNWIHEGRNKTNKNKIYFFKQYSRIKSNKNRKIEKILKYLRNGKTKEESCKLAYVSVKAFDIWYNYGKLGKDQINIDFYNKIKLIEESNENFINENCKYGHFDLIENITVKTQS